MIDCIDYQDVKRFKPLILDYINQDQRLQSFYNHFPLVSNFVKQIELKSSSYNSDHRKILVSYLKNQYQNYTLTPDVIDNIEALKQNRTFTITTGHQLNLFCGPLYTFYKIVSVIKTCEKLKREYPDYNFVPLFWMASEDHDFDEINHFYFQNEKLGWHKNSMGAVGEFSTSGLEDLEKKLHQLLPESQEGATLLELFKKSYLNHSSLSEASIYLYNELFGKYGLIILEPNHKDLKSCLKPYIEKELFDNITHINVSETTLRLKKLGYHEQVTPREINFFYKIKNLRERLILKNDKYYVNGTEMSFSHDEMKDEIDQYPERFSPNALLRPLYQEVLLPNLSYVGGAGELAYWMQLKSTFQSFDIRFPMLQMRDSVLLVSNKTVTKLEKLDVEIVDLFQSEIELKNQKTHQLSDIEIDFTPQKKHLVEQFKSLYQLAKETDQSFINAVAAQEKKQINGLDKLEKRLLKAQRKKLKDQLDRLVAIQKRLFPKNNLQERVVNFSELYLMYGDLFLEYLIEHQNPFNYTFSILQMSDKPKGIESTFKNNLM